MLIGQPLGSVLDDGRLGRRERLGVRRCRSDGEASGLGNGGDVYVEPLAGKKGEGLLVLDACLCLILAGCTCNIHEHIRGWFCGMQHRDDDLQAMYSFDS